MKQYEVYCHTNTLNNKSYIGYTSQSTLKRLHKHILNANYGIQSHFYRAIRKYGIRTKEHIEKLSGTQFKKGIKWNEQPQNKKSKGGNTN